jgi:TRAP-type mannitol/chloroaromatic compound transport system substrate-binding protein
MGMVFMYEKTASKLNYLTEVVFMRKKGILISVIALVICFFLVSISQAEVIKWRMATARTPALTPFHEADLHFAEVVNKMSAGRMIITVHPAGELMPAFEVFDGVRKGVVEAGAAWSTYWTGKDTAFDLYCSVAFMMTAPDYITWLYSGDGLKLGQELYGKYKLVFFPIGLTGPESGYRTNKPIKTIADFKGVMLRTGFLQAIWVMEQIGAKPMRIPGGEIYMALKLGTIDGAEFSVPATDWSLKFQETTKYWITPMGWHQVAAVADLMINENAWAKLPADLKAVVETAAQANVMWTYAKANWDNMTAIENFEKAGTKESRLDQKTLDRLQELCTQYIEIESKKNPNFAKIAKSMVVYLKRFDKVRAAEGPFAFGTALKKYPVIQ